MMAERTNGLKTILNFWQRICFCRLKLTTILILTTVLANTKAAFANLKTAMEDAKELPLYGQANLVFGEGNSEAEVMFIGEAPGFHEDKFMRPFVGQAGKLLDKLFVLINWPRESVYITNIVK